MAQSWFRHLISGLCIFWNTAGFDLLPSFLFSLCQYCSVAIGLDSHPDEHVPGPLKRTVFLMPWLSSRGQSLVSAKEKVHGGEGFCISTYILLYHSGFQQHVEFDFFSAHTVALWEYLPQIVWACHHCPRSLVTINFMVWLCHIMSATTTQHRMSKQGNSVTNMSCTLQHHLVLPC